MRIAIDRRLSLIEQPNTGHNRWHPDIPPIARVRPGETIEIDTRDALDGQVKRETTAADISNFRRNVAHALTGPVYVEGAQPGDLLAVHIDRIEPQATAYTSFRGPDFGFLRREFPYIICSVAVDLHISQIVDVPNFTVSAFLPLAIFE